MSTENILPFEVPLQTDELPGYEFTTCTSASGRMAAKRITPQKTEGYGKETHWRYATYHLRTHEEFADGLRRLSTLRGMMIIRGTPIKGLDLTQPQLRISAQDEKNTLDDPSRHWLVLDLDDVLTPPGLGDATKLHDAATFVRDVLLPKEFHDTTCIVTATASSGRRGPDIARMRMYFLTTKAFDNKTLKAWALGVEAKEQLPIDSSVFQAGQPIYTARPLFEGGSVDPVPEADWVFVLDGKSRRVELDVERYAGEGRRRLIDAPITGEAREYQGDTPYARRTLRRAVREIEHASERKQDKTLFYWCLRIGRLVAGGVFERQEAGKVLLDAGLKMPSFDQTRPWTENAIREKIHRCFELGAKEPLNAPDNAWRLNCEDFAAFLPNHKYIYRTTGELWVGSGVNDAVIGELRIINDKETYVPASKLISEQTPVHQMSWAPGEGEFIYGAAITGGGRIIAPDNIIYNKYRAPIIEPKEGDPTPWLNHIKKLYPGDVNHITAWSAQRVQRPGEKLNHALVLGGVEGIGKDTLLEPLRRAVGSWNFAEISPEDISTSFDEYAQSVVLRISEAKDLGDLNKYKFYDATKTLIAAPPETLRINVKYVPEYYIPNVTGVIITTNYKTTGLYLPQTDRRHYVAWSDSVKGDFTEAYWNAIWQWYYSGGFEIVAYYLLHYDLTKFNPKASPKQTEAFWAVVDASQRPEDTDMADLLDYLGNPKVVPVAHLKECAAETIVFESVSILMAKSFAALSGLIDKCGYRPIKNPDAKDGCWKAGISRQKFYAKQDLSDREAFVEVQNYIKKWNDMKRIMQKNGEKLRESRDETDEIPF